MSQNTNKLFWMSALAIVFVITGIAIYNGVGKPSNQLYNNANSETLCNSFYEEGLITCLDASSNSNLGQYDGKTNTWKNQLESNGATLSGFDFNEHSGWDVTSLLFDGNNDTLTIPIKNNEIKDKFSLLTNIKLVNIPSERKLMVSNNGLNVYLNNNGKFDIVIKGQNGEKTLSSNLALETDAWYSLMISYDNDLLTLYINGQLDSSIPANLGDVQLSNNINISNVNMYMSSFAVWKNTLEKDNINQNTTALNNKILDIDKYVVGFNYTGNCELWKAPYEGDYQIELWGAEGSGYNGGTAGAGAYTSGNIELKKDQQLYVCVGQKGNNTGSSFNGTISGASIYAGGGATDIRLDKTTNWYDFNSLKSRIMVAAGGGTSNGTNNIAGAGGTISGVNSQDNIVGIINATGGKIKTSGANIKVKDGFNSSQLSSYLVNNGKISGFGFAYNGAGNGYFGGGGFGNNGSGAGGSSYVSGSEEVESLHATSKSNNLIFAKGGHYSGYEFSSPKMISGNTEIEDPITKNITIGHKGNGYAKITLIDVKNKVEDKNPNSVDFKQPGKPVVKQTQVYDKIAEIYFDEVNFAQSYKCYYGLDENNLNEEGRIVTIIGQTQQCELPNLTQNTKYYYKLIAINGTKETESDINNITTQYSTPNKASLLNYETTDNSLTSVFKIDETSTNYICYSGVTKDSQTTVGVMVKDGDKVTCSFDNLAQNNNYFVRLDTINGDKQSSSDVITIKTDYVTPEIPVLENFSKTQEEVSLVYAPLEHYTDVKCYMGTKQSEVNTEIETEINNGKIMCYTDGLTEGTNYYFKVKVINDTKTVNSDVSTVRTDYKAPEKPILVNSTITSSSITTEYSDNNSTLSNVKYICSYGTDGIEFNGSGTLIEGLDGNKKCSYNSLNENTVYYTKLTVRNGSEYTDSEVSRIITDYNVPKAPIYKTSYVYDSNSFAIEYNVDNINYNFGCKASREGETFSGVMTKNPSTNSITCNFENLVGASYEFNSYAVNGKYQTDSDKYSQKIDRVLPVLKVTVDSNQFNSNGWAKNDILVKAEASSKINGQITGLAYCIGSSDCNPSYSSQVEMGEIFYTANEGTTILEGDFTSHDIYMSNESSGSKICFVLLANDGDLSKQCYGPYKLDKTNPTITGSNVTIADTVNTYDVYSGMTITDNLSANDKITKSYNTTPTWGNSGEYSVTYTVTDLAGNSSTLTRKFTITLTNFDISYNLNGGSMSGQKTSYNKKTDTFTLPTPSRGGYNFTGWTGTGLSSATKTVTINKGSSGARSYTANWSPISYSLSYNYNGGSASNPSSYNIESNNFTLNNPSRGGYNFTGWSGSGSGTSVTIYKGSTGNKSFTANWSPVTYSIGYNLNGGWSCSYCPGSYNIESGTIYLGTPVRTGYVFDGWSDGGVVWGGSTGNRSFTANWHRYSAYDAGGIYIEVTRDGEWWSGAPNGDYGVGTNASPAGTWTVSVPNAYQMSINGTNTVTKQHTYRIWVYARNNHGLLLGYGEQTLSSGKANITVSW